MRKPFVLPPQRGLENSAIESLEAINIEAEASALLLSLSETHVGVCLCDENDNIRYANDAFRAAFFDHHSDNMSNFVEALACAISAGKGIRLVSISLGDFITRVKDRRRHGPPRYDFSVDLADGSWWWVNDRRLSNGWMLVIASDISSIKHEEFRLRSAHATALHAAQTDFLTGLPNRRYGIERTTAAIDEFRANRLPLTVAVLDIDHFKAVNDTYGHEVGDMVLAAFADELRECAHSRDQVCRLGGEEFLLVMPDTSTSRGVRRLAKLDVGVTIPKGEGDGVMRVSFSAGLTSAHFTDDLKTLLARADSALYTAKTKGRGRIEVLRKKLA
jgi:diguanylate cyclase